MRGASKSTHQFLPPFEKHSTTSRNKKVVVRLFAGIMWFLPRLKWLNCVRVKTVSLHCISAKQRRYKRILNIVSFTFARQEHTVLTGDVRERKTLHLSSTNFMCVYTALGTTIYLFVRAYLEVSIDEAILEFSLRIIVFFCVSWPVSLFWSSWPLLTQLQKLPLPLLW